MTRKLLGNGEKSESCPLIFNSHAIFSDEDSFTKSKEVESLSSDNSIFGKLMKPKIEELLRERGVCFRCCKPCSGEDFCAPCKKFLTATNCAHCGRKTMTTWRVHCVPCCKIINSKKCKVCQKPTHSDWKEYCYDCHEDEKEKKRKIKFYMHGKNAFIITRIIR